jgi:beta-lactamase superfamily II metal-dependent hydrolase
MKLRSIPLRWSLAAIAVLGVLLGRLVLSQPNGTLQIMLPAIPGDGALVVTPQGHTLLIDGGEDGAALATWLGEHVPFGQRRIDAVVLTRPTDQTLPGQLAAIKRYEVGSAFVVAGEDPSDQMTAWRQLLNERGTPIQVLAAGQRVPVGKCAFDVLTANNGHATFRLD